LANGVPDPDNDVDMGAGSTEAHVTEMNGGGVPATEGAAQPAVAPGAGAAAGASSDGGGATSGAATEPDNAGGSGGADATDDAAAGATNGGTSDAAGAAGDSPAAANPADAAATADAADDKTNGSAPSSPPRIIPLDSTYVRAGAVAARAARAVEDLPGCCTGHHRCEHHRPNPEPERSHGTRVARYHRWCVYTPCVAHGCCGFV